MPYVREAKTRHLVHLGELNCYINLVGTMNVVQCPVLYNLSSMTL
jgi:hypothetical protein